MAPMGGCLGSCLEKMCRILGRGSSEPGPPGISTQEAGKPPAPPADARQSDAVQAFFQLLKQEQHALERHALGQLPEGLAKSLLARLDELQAADFCVSAENASCIANSAGVGYQEVYTGPEMTVCIFLLRAGGRMPLHDHPEMHVFGRLLFGRLRVLSLDLEPLGVEPGNGAPPRRSPGSLWATLYSDAVLGPTPVTYSLSPTEGNLHELEALEDSAFLDVVTPPYDSLAGRDCTYYARSKDPDPSHAGRYALVQTWPRDFSTELQDYRGPVFIA